MYAGYVAYIYRNINFTYNALIEISGANYRRSSHELFQKHFIAHPSFRYMLLSNALNLNSYLQD